MTSSWSMMVKIQGNDHKWGACWKLFPSETNARQEANHENQVLIVCPNTTMKAKEKSPYGFVVNLACEI